MTSNVAIPEDLVLDTPLWRFAAEFWSRNSAMEACLELQAQRWSVTDLLCALWLASEDTRFEGLSDEKVLAWRSAVTEPLREARKAIPKGNPVTESARNCVARGELESEKVELALAYRILSVTVAGNVAMHQFKNGTAKSLSLNNLQAAAPEKTMDNRTGMLLATLADELHDAVSGEFSSC